jgi:hypothetical protein
VDDHQAVLHALVVRGFCAPAALVVSTGLDPDEVAAALDDLERDGLARQREGRIAGWSPSPAGRGRHRQLLLSGGRAPAERRAAVAHYRRFATLNRDVKELCTDWQLRDGGPNDHTDAAYDDGIIHRLRSLHARAAEWLGGMERHLPGAARYGTRLQAALLAVEAGDRDRFAHPLSESYHDIWMELHQDLLITLELERTSTDA